MKILLINPPEMHEILDNTPGIISEGRGYSPPLGLLYVAAYLEDFSSHEVVVVDCQVEELDYHQLQERVCEYEPDVVGITVMTMTLIDVLETIKAVKKVNPEIKLVLGGPHVHLFPKETICLEGVDFIVLGEGEEAFKQLLDCIDNPKRMRNVPGIMFYDGDEIVNTGIRPPVDDLDALPFPARHLVPYKKYSSVLARRDPVTSIFTSRGCPFHCRFCDRPHLGKRFRARSAKNVVDEIEECKNMGIHELLVYDDTFTVNKKRVIDICDEMIRRNLDVGFDIRSRVDTVDEEMLVQLKRAGCQGIHYGIEAGTEKIIKVLNKGITLEKAGETFRITRKHRIPILAYFMIGNPTETIEDIRTTFKVMKRLNPDYVHITVLTPFPGTEIYKSGVENEIESGFMNNDLWQKFAKHPDRNFVPPYWGESFAREELISLAAQGYRTFYLRPTYIFWRLMRLQSWNEFRKKAGGGLRLLSLYWKS